MPVHCLDGIAITKVPLPALVKFPLPVITASSYNSAINSLVLIVPPPRPSLMVLSLVKLLNNCDLDSVNSNVPLSKLTSDFLELVYLPMASVLTTPLLIIFRVPLPRAPTTVIGADKFALFTVTSPTESTLRSSNPPICNKRLTFTVALSVILTLPCPL